MHDHPSGCLPEAHFPGEKLIFTQPLQDKVPKFGLLFLIIQKVMLENNPQVTISSHSLTKLLHFSWDKRSAFVDDDLTAGYVERII